MRSDLFSHEMVKTGPLFSRKSDIRVVFRGQQAATDGKTIILPALKGGKDIPETEVKVMRGFTDHEAGHNRFSDMGLIMSKYEAYGRAGRTLAKNLHNACEDIWMEARVMREYPGSETNLRATTEAVSKMTLDAIAEDPKRLMLLNFPKKMLPGMITWVGRKDYGGALVRELIDMIPDHLMPVLQDIVARIGGCESTADVFELSEEIERQLLDNTIPSPKPSEGEGGMKIKVRSKPGEGEGQPDSDEDSGEDDDAIDLGLDEDDFDTSDKEKGDDTGGEEADEDSEPEGEGSAEPGEEDEGGAEAEGEGDGSDGAGKAGDTEEAGEGAGDADGGSDVAGDEAEGEGHEHGPDADDAAGGEAGEKPDGLAHEREIGGPPDEREVAESKPDATFGGEPEEEEIDLDVESEEDLPEFDLPELSDAVEASTKDYTAATIEEGEYVAVGQEHDVWLTAEDPGKAGRVKDRINNPLGETRYEHLVEGESGTINVIRATLERVLMAQMKRDWHHGLEEGRLDSRRLSQLVAGRSNVFMQPAPRKELDTAVSLCVDLSGSMGSPGGRGVRPKIHIATETVIALCEAMERLAVPHEVSGFTQPFEPGKWGLGSPDPWEVPTDASRYMPIVMVEFKPFNKPLAACRTPLGNMMDMALDHNIDGESILYAYERLARRPEQKKVLIVLSDGLPEASGYNGDALYQNLKDSVAYIEGRGVQVVGIGIATDAVRQFYGRHVVVNNLDHLAETGLGILQEVLMSNLHPEPTGMMMGAE